MWRLVVTLILLQKAAHARRSISSGTRIFLRNAALLVWTVRCVSDGASSDVWVCVERKLLQYFNSSWWLFVSSLIVVRPDDGDSHAVFFCTVNRTWRGPWFPSFDDASVGTLTSTRPTSWCRCPHRPAIIWPAALRRCWSMLFASAGRGSRYRSDGTPTKSVPFTLYASPFLRAGCPPFFSCTGVEHMNLGNTNTSSSTGNTGGKLEPPMKFVGVLLRLLFFWESRAAAQSPRRFIWVLFLSTQSICLSNTTRLTRRCFLCTQKAAAYCTASAVLRSLHACRDFTIHRSLCCNNP